MLNQVDDQFACQNRYGPPPEFSGFTLFSHSSPSFGLQQVWQVHPLSNKSNAAKGCTYVCYFNQISREIVPFMNSSVFVRITIRMRNNKRIQEASP